MELSRHILKEFADVSRGVERDDKTQYLRGTIKCSGEAKYVRIDGSESLTPISEIVDVKDGDRVLVTIENHEATILGNLTMPPSAYKEQEAIDKAEDAQGTANDANDKAETAKTLAQSAGDKADAAVVDAGNASAAANQAKQDAAEAITAAGNASKNSTEAKQLATAAGQNAETARQEAALAQNAATAAQGEVTRIEGVVTGVKGDINTALEDVANQAAETAAIKETLSVEYAKKTEVSDVQAALTTEISKKVGELQTTVSQTYAAKNDVVAMEGRLQSQITQTSGEVSSVVGKVEQLESDTTEAQKKVDEALEKSAAAQVAANQAQANATASQAAADAAKANADTATKKANEAVQNAATAAATAAEADKKVAEAKTDLAEAKENLANTMNRVDATEADIAEAQKKVETAQAAVTQAQKDAAEATLAANNAQTAANKAQNDATEAQNAANNAQKKADNAAIAANDAQAAADKAQQDVAALTKRVTSAETAISQNAEQIKLSATKTEEIGTKLENLKVGGRNLLHGTVDFIDVGSSYNSGRLIETGFPLTGDKYKGLAVRGKTNISGTHTASCYSFSNFNLGETYTFSFYAKGSIDRFRCYFYGDTGYVTATAIDTNIGWMPGTYGDGMVMYRNGSGSSKELLDSNIFKRYYVTWKLNNTGDTSIVKKILIRTDEATSGNLYICGEKMEIGNKNTDHSPSPEDQQAQIDSTNSNLRNNYYSKTQTDAAIKVAADNVTTTVRTETTEQITNINVGTDNLIRNGGNVTNISHWNCTWEDCFKVVTHPFYYNATRNIFRLSNTSATVEKHVASERFEVKRNTDYTLTFSGFYNDMLRSAEVHFLARKKDETAPYSHVQTFGPIVLSTDSLVTKIIKFNSGNNDTAYIRFDNNATKTDGQLSTLYFIDVMLVEGTVAKKWQPCKLDYQEGIDQAQNDANEANSKADATEERVTVAESTIKQLSDSISMLVTDSNGSSMMTQTSDGWTFNIGAITDAIDNASNNIDSLASSLSQANHTINNLNNLANDLSKKTAYINMTTDDTGSPCIELGKVGNAFKVRITNTSVDFIEGSSKIAYVSNHALFIEKAIIKNELQIGESRGFIWKTRSNGNLGLRWFG